MTKLKTRSKLFLAAAGGLAGFFILITAGITYFILAVSMGGFGFGAGLLSPSESFIISVIVSVLISLGAGIPAWALGANRRRGLLAGLVAMSVFIYISSKGQDINYAPFIEYDTLAYISAILVSTVIATIVKNKIRFVGIAILIALTLEILRLRNVLSLVYPYSEQMIGFVASLLAWIFLPLIAAFFVTLEQNEQIINESIKILGSKVADQFQKPKLLFAIAGGIFVLVVIFSIVDYQETRKLSTPDLIGKAYIEGKISEEERLLYLAYAMFEYESLPKRFHGSAPWSGTFILAELYEAANSPSVLCSMSPSIRSEFQRLLHPKITCD
ncbi:MAG TPA: hypothetical protein VGA72_09255 [Anaerolineales bacterium]